MYSTQCHLLKGEGVLVVLQHQGPKFRSPQLVGVTIFVARIELKLEKSGLLQQPNSNRIYPRLLMLQ